MVPNIITWIVQEKKRSIEKIIACSADCGMPIVCFPVFVSYIERVDRKPLVGA